MKIINKTDLTYKDIGMIIDGIIKSSVGDTCYVGKIDYCFVGTSKGTIKVQIRYMKRDVEWAFTKVGENDAM